MPSTVEHKEGTITITILSLTLIYLHTTLYNSPSREEGKKGKEGEEGKVFS